MNLNGTWKLYFAPEGSIPVESVLQLASSGIPSIPCTVPGNVELDLSAAGLLPEDLFMGCNIEETEKFEHYEWWYETSFTAPATLENDRKMVLHFGGVDCFADYYLNGEKIGESDNMFIAHDFDVSKKLRYGQENTLHVHLASATVRGAAVEKDLQVLAYGSHDVGICQYVRKPPHCYGWDIMPRAVSAGIWRNVELRNLPVYDYQYIYAAVTKLEGSTGTVRFLVDTRVPAEYAYADLTYTFTGRCGDHTFHYSEMRKGSAGMFVFPVENLRLWWPNPYGEANLYDVTVEIHTKDGELLLTKTVRRGFRTLELRRTEMVQDDGCFEFVVNGVRIMAVGTNWVPMDVFHSRDASRYQRALELVADVGCNIIRCWGGNVYEDHAFFNFCDEHGIMVWQDFAMACNFYPQDDEFQQVMRREAEWVVQELRDHPSLALWSGDNENDAMYFNRGRNPDLNRITRETLPRVVDRLDPYRPYLASSPYISTKLFNMGGTGQGNRNRSEDHLWGPRDYHKSAFYTNSEAYFVSEVGYHGCPHRKSIEKFIEPDKIWPYFDNDQWNLHSTRHYKYMDSRVMLMHKQVNQLFRDVPTDMDDYTLASQISQAEAKKFFIERVRCQMKRMGGVIWWNLMDGWPQMSDAVVDYYYEKKLAYDYIKRSSRPFMVMIEEFKAWSHPVVCANSTLHEVTGRVIITDMDTDKVIFEKEFTAAPNSNTQLGSFDLMHSQQGMFLIRWETEQEGTHCNTYLYGTPAYDLQHYKLWLRKLAEAEESDRD